MTPEEMEAALSVVVVTRSIAHAENILVLLRQNEEAGMDHATNIRTIYDKVMDPTASL